MVPGTGLKDLEKRYVLADAGIRNMRPSDRSLFTATTTVY